MNPMPNAFMTINLSAPAETPAAESSPSRPLGDVAAGPNSVSPGDVISSLPNGESEPSVTLACAPGENLSQAKATKGSAGMAGAIGPVRRSTAGTGLQVGEASADLPATSEIMDVTGRRDGHSIQQSPMANGGHQEAPAAAANPVAAGATDLLGSNISDVGEIFYFARLLCARARLHPEEDISPAIVDICDDVWRDPPPQFLREGWR